MDYRPLGAAGAKVSPLCLGTMTFGEADERSFMHEVGCDEKTAFAIMDRALEAGVSFFDTANVYGQDGLSERVVGNWIAQGGRRDKIVLATKFRFRMGSGPNETGASRYHLVRAVDESLRRLRTDRIDLYQIHMEDVTVREEETLRGLDDLVRAGKVVYFGASNYAAYRLVDSLWTSRELRLEKFVTLQAEYSLITRDLERELIPACLRFGLGVLPYSPLAGGFLSGKYTKDAPPPKGARLDKWRERLGSFDNPRNWRILEALVQVAREVQATPSQVALAWLIGRPAVTSVIFGARSVAQLEDNLRAGELHLPPEARRRLDEASAFPLGHPYEFMQRAMGRW